METGQKEASPSLLHTRFLLQQKEKAGVLKAERGSRSALEQKSFLEAWPGRGSDARGERDSGTPAPGASRGAPGRRAPALGSGWLRAACGWSPSCEMDGTSFSLIVHLRSIRKRWPIRAALRSQGRGRHVWLQSIWIHSVNCSWPPPPHSVYLGSFYPLASLQESAG